MQSLWNAKIEWVPIILVHLDLSQKIAVLLKAADTILR